MQADGWAGSSFPSSFDQLAEADAKQRASCSNSARDRESSGVIGGRKRSRVDCCTRNRKGGCHRSPPTLPWSFSTFRSVHGTKCVLVQQLFNKRTVSLLSPPNLIVKTLIIRNLHPITSHTEHPLTPEKGRTGRAALAPRLMVRILSHANPPCNSLNARALCSPPSLAQRRKTLYSLDWAYMAHSRKLPNRDIKT